MTSQISTTSAVTAAARGGLQIHAAVTVAVIALLTVINLLTVPEFPWFIFPTIGMALGVGARYVFALPGSPDTSSPAYDPRGCGGSRPLRSAARRRASRRPLNVAGTRRLDDAIRHGGAR